jgi:hypothetical protein
MADGYLASFSTGKKKKTKPVKVSKQAPSPVAHKQWYYGQKFVSLCLLH